MKEKQYRKCKSPKCKIINEVSPNVTQTNFKLRWGEKQQNASDHLKSQLMKTSVLSYPDMTKPFFLMTDASSYALDYGEKIIQLPMLVED